MQSKLTRRDALQAGGMISLVGLTGCLRTATEPSSGGGEQAATDSPSSTPAGTGSSTASTERLADEITAVWERDASFGDVVAAAGTFYRMTDNPATIAALDIEGNEIWQLQDDRLPAIFRGGCHVSGTTLAVSGSRGGFGVINTDDGSIRWTTTEPPRTGWGSRPVIAGSYIAGINEDSTDEPQVIYVFDESSGEVIFSTEHEQAGGVAIVGNRLYVSALNNLEMYNLQSGEQVWTRPEYLGGSLDSMNDRLYVAPNQFISAYQLSEEEATQQWSTDLRGEPVGVQAAQTGVYVGGNGGIYAFDLEGQRRWWGRADGEAGRPALSDQTVFASTTGQQLVAFDQDTGNQIGQITAHEQEYVSPSVAATGQTVVIAAETTQAFRRPTES